MKIILPSSFEELGKITFKEPVSVEVHAPCIDGKIYFDWDCGMEGSPIDPETNWCGIINHKEISQKVVRACKYDLAHAFFHYEGDPNYTHYHWALRSIYSPKIVATQDE